MRRALLVLLALLLAAPALAGGRVADPARLPAAERPELAAAVAELERLEGVPVEPIDPPGLPDETPAGEDAPLYSLVWADAVFRTHRDGYGQEVRDRDGFGDRADHLGEALLVRLVGRTEALVEVEVAEVERWRHCVDDPPVDDAWRIRLFVRPDDLVLVTGEPFAMQAEDGSSVALRPGVPWLGGEVSFDGLVFPLPELPQEHVGVAYRPPPRPDGPERYLGALPASASPTLFGRPVRIPAAAGHWVEDWSDGLATLVSPCGTVVLRSDLGPVKGDPGYLLADLRDPATWLRAPAGTSLHWPDGAPAGALTEARLFLDAELTPGELRCAEVPFGRGLEGRSRPDLHICFLATDLERVD